MEVVVSVLIPAIVESVFGALTEAVGLSDWLRQRLGRDPEKLAFQQALTQALTDCVPHYPGRDLRYFAEILADRTIGSPLLARTLQPAATLPTADELTTVWLNHLTVDSLIHYRAEFSHFATHFLDRLQFHLENQQPLQWIVQARRQRSSEEAIGRMADAAAQSAINVEAMRQEIARLTSTLVTVLQTSNGSTVTTDGGAYVGSNVRAQHFAGRDLTINQYFVEGLARLVFNYSARIENFLFEYLGGTDKRVPFGGRQAQIDQLNTWLDDPATPPYLLMVAEAGGGKSALVTHWCAQLATRTDLDVIFVPISIRFQTAAQDVAFAALAARLAQIYEQQSTLPAALSAEQWKGQCETYLRLPLPPGKRLVVVIDGLDEATGWESGPELFAKRPPAGLRILVTARVRAKEVNADRWALRLGWHDDQTARKLHLPGLDRYGIAEALASMGNPLAHLTTQVDLVGELHRLSQGDPLLVRLYVEALQAMGAAVADLRPEDLADIEPGLDGFMERWWEDQRKQWRMQGKDPFAEEERLLPLLHACTVACGPLLLNDLAELDKQHFGKGLLVTHMAELLGRWVIGDGRKQGYVFSHPRLRNYFSDRMTPDEEREWQTKFCGWGERVLQDLNAGKLDPKQAPEYVLRYYSTHLERSHAPAEAFYALISNGWRLAWEELDVSYGGFLGDINRTWTKITHDLHLSRAGRSTVLVQQICILLCQASVVALSSNLQPTLLAQLVSAGIYTPVQAISILKQVADGQLRAEMLIAVAPYLSVDLLKEGLSTAYTIRDEFNRVNALVALITHLSPTLLSEMLAASHAIQNESERARLLIALAPCLPADRTMDALAAIYEIKNLHPRADALISLIPYIPEPEQRKVVTEVINVANIIEDEFVQSQTLSMLAPYLPADLLDRVLNIIYKIRNLSPRVNALVVLAPYLQEDKHKVMIEVLHVIPKMNEMGRTKALSTLASNLPIALLNETLQQTNKLEDEHCRTDVIIALAPYLPTELLWEALSIAYKLKDAEHRANALIAVESHLPENEETLTEELFAARVLKSVYDRDDTQNSFSTHLAENEKDTVKKIMHMICAIEDGYHRATQLVELVPRLPVELLEEALAIARTVKNESVYADMLVTLAPRLPKHEQKDILQEALDSSRAIRDKLYCTHSLSLLTPYLPEVERRKVLIEGLSAIYASGDESACADLFAVLAPRLPTDLLQEALWAADSIKNVYHHTDALVALTPHLPVNLQREVLATVRKIEDDFARAEALCSLTPCLDNELRKQVLAEALAVVSAIQIEGYFADVLPTLAPYLFTNLLRKALASAKSMEDESARTKVIVTLMPHLPINLAAEVLTIASAIENKVERLHTMVALFPYLPQNEQNKILNQVLSVVYTLDNELAYTKLLALLIPYLPENKQKQVIEELLTTAGKIVDGVQQVYILTILAPYLDNIQKEKVLTGVLPVVHAIKDERHRVQILHNLAQHLSINLLGEALTNAAEIIDVYDRAEALRMLAPQLAVWAIQQPKRSHLSLVNTLSILASRPRPDFALDLAALMPFILALAGDEAPQAAEGIYQAIQEVCEWWP